MLGSSEDPPRLIDCATDQVRHDRMRDLTGGDVLGQAQPATQLVHGARGSPC